MQGSSLFMLSVSPKVLVNTCFPGRHQFHAFHSPVTCPLFPSTDTPPHQFSLLTNVGVLIPVSDTHRLCTCLCVCDKAIYNYNPLAIWYLKISWYLEYVCIQSTDTHNFPKSVPFSYFLQKKTCLMIHWIIFKNVCHPFVYS